jgi:hypothetical protein
MATARPLPLDLRHAGGVGELNATRAANLSAPPNPNRGLDQYVVSDGAGGQAFDAVGWDDAAKSDIGWDAVGWSDLAWANTSVSAVGWGDVSWEEVSLADVSISDVSISDVSLNDVSLADGADGDSFVAGASAVDPAQLAADAGTTARP